ncbi:MAG TPA: TrmH family RNA methyltransferase [Longimicrobiales bacterium]
MQELVDRFRRARRDPDLAVLEGFHPLKHALRFGAEILEGVAVDPERVEALSRALAPDVAERVRAALDIVTPEVFERLTPAPPPTGVIALARRPAVAVGRTLEGAAPAPVVYLEDPSSPWNIGAAVRVAAAAGAAALITSGAQDPWRPSALRAGVGLQYALPVARVHALPRSDRPLLALDPEGEPLRPAMLPARAILAFGSERRGLSPELLAAADRRIRIPMREGVSSLNLATAVAAVLYAWRLREA